MPIDFHSLTPKAQKLLNGFCCREAESLHQVTNGLRPQSFTNSAKSLPIAKNDRDSRRSRVRLRTGIANRLSWTRTSSFQSATLSSVRRFTRLQRRKCWASRLIEQLLKPAFYLQSQNLFAASELIGESSCTERMGSRRNARSAIERSNWSIAGSRSPTATHSTLWSG